MSMFSDLNLAFILSDKATQPQYLYPTITSIIFLPESACSLMLFLLAEGIIPFEQLLQQL